MNPERKSKHGHRGEKGIALLIAIFVLLLISVVAIALLVSSGTETALGANYRSSSTVYYAALAGLEEARGRLLPKNPNYLGASTSYVSPNTAFTLTPSEALYVINPLPGENVAPTDQSNLYYDKEYKQEFGIEASAVSNSSSIFSVWYNNPQGIPGPSYKWVRINAASERSIYMDVDQNHPTVLDGTTPLYYDSGNIVGGNLWPALIVSATPPATATQALEITALAYVPSPFGAGNGSQKILQYLVAPVKLNVQFPAALTIDGNSVNFSVPDSASFFIQGNDSNPTPVPNCSPGINPVSAIGYTDSSDNANIRNNLAYLTNFPGTGSSPSVNQVSPVGGFQYLHYVSGLNTLAQNVTQGADLVLTGPITQSDSNNLMPSWMSASNPATVVVNGDLTFNGWHASGYGILLVTGKLTYDPDTSWNGIVLVIGQGQIVSSQAGQGQFNGAMLVATTVNSSGNPLSPSSAAGSPIFNFPPSGVNSSISDLGGKGIYYSSCWVQYVQMPMTYKVLSFHEISQ